MPLPRHLCRLDIDRGIALALQGALAEREAWYRSRAEAFAAASEEALAAAYRRRAEDFAAVAAAMRGQLAAHGDAGPHGYRLELEDGIARMLYAVLDGRSQEHFVEERTAGDRREPLLAEAHAARARAYADCANALLHQMTERAPG